MKRRVQAQRKFAQGVPTPAQAVLETSQPAPPTPARDKSLIQSKISASVLLDVVSCRNFHTHKIPIVVLERLTEKKSMEKTQKQIAATLKVTSPKIKAKSATSSPKGTKAKVASKVGYMRLRPRKTLKDKCIKSKKRSLRLKSQSTELAAPIPARKVARKKTIDTIFVSDDERPLKYFIASRDIPVATFKEPAAPSVRPVANTKPSTRSSDPFTEIHDPKDFPAEIHDPKDSSDKIENPQSPKSGNESIATKIIVKDDAMVNIPDIDMISIKSCVSSKLLEDNTNDNESVRITSPSIIIDDQRTVLYGDRGIEKWMEGWSAFKGWETLNGNGSLASMAPIQRELTPERPNSAIEHSEAVYNCQGKGCQQCSHCQVANKCETLRERLSSNVTYSGREGAPQGASQRASADVYNFDAECDDAPPQGSYQPRKQRPPPPPSIASTTYGDENKLYFDIFPPHVPQIIELTAHKVANSKNRMMKARLISRSECPAHPKKMSLVEHEILLDELLQMIPAVNQPQASKGHFKIPNHPGTRSASKNKGVVGKETCKRDNNTLEPDEPVPSMAKSQPQPTEAAASPKTPATENSKAAPAPAPELTEPPPPTTPPIFESAKVVDAPTYYLTEKEFNDPIVFFEKIAPAASKYGICKVVPPKNFNPECVLDDSINFNVTNQYIARLYSRWGPCAREMAAIKACLSTQGVKFKRPPLIGGLELDLPKLYKEVQKLGGLNEVNEKKSWNTVAGKVGCPSIPNPERKLDSLYVKYLVPYETLSHQERQQIKSSVETAWTNRNKKLLDWAFNPLQQQKKLFGEADSSESEAEEDDVMIEALDEAEDCVVRGRKMKLVAFQNVALSAEKAFLKEKTTLFDLEGKYWGLVLFGERHVCVNAASIDTGDHGYGFSKGKTPCAKYPWNLKRLSANAGNVLRSLGAVLGVTVPTLHLGMVFSTSCWHRDPHGLPWVEYMHHGASKIWYGIPNEQSTHFRKAVEALCPTSCQNKSIWLPSDITMIPPNLLREHNVCLSRVVQNPGEYIIVFPKAYSCSISTGFTVSESVYFATNSWLNTVHKVFQELRESCEPTTFSLEQLLISIAKDIRAPLSVLPLTHAGLATVMTDELRNRRELTAMGIPTVSEKKSQGDVWNVREEAECEYCRATLYLSKVTGITGRSSAVCLTHALQMLQKKCGENEVTKLELVLFFSDKELDDILTNLQKRLT